MTLFDSVAFEGHESVNAFYDEKTGLKTIIAVHSTALGPAAGGCRMWPYATSEDALTDALRLSPRHVLQERGGRYRPWRAARR